MNHKKIEIFSLKRIRYNNNEKFSNEIKKLSKIFLNFLKKYRSIDNFQFYFTKKLPKNLKGSINKIPIDLFDIAQFDPVLYFHILKFPTEMISICDYTINKIFETSIKKNKILKKKIKISFLSTIKNQVLKIESLSPEHLNKMVIVEGVVIKLAYLTPEITTAFFKCEICSFETYYFIEKGKLFEPIYCFNCKNFNSFQLIMNRSGFTDRQYFYIQETLQSEFPSILLLIAYDEIIEKIKIGDVIKVIGILRISSFTKGKILKPQIFFNFYLDTLNLKLNIFKSLNRKNFKIEKLARKKKIKKFSNYAIIIMLSALVQNPKIYKIFHDSMIVGLNGLDTIKQSILVIFVKIMWKENINGNFPLFNKILNLLLVGKLGIVESYILKFIPKFFPKTIYLDGKNFNINEKINDEALSNQKENQLDKTLSFFYSQNSEIFSINGIDKFPKNFLRLFQEIIKNQTILSVKNGVISKMKTKISIIGSINLFYWKNSNKFYRKNLLIGEIFNFIFFSFDFIYFITDSISIFKDFNFANHVLKSIYPKLEKKKKRFLGIGFKDKTFYRFLKIFQNYPIPFFSEFSIKELLKWETTFVSLKKFKREESKGKQFEISELLINITIVLSLLRFSPIIGAEDIRYSVIILIEALKSLKNRI